MGNEGEIFSSASSLQCGELQQRTASLTINYFFLPLTLAVNFG